MTSTEASHTGTIEKLKRYLRLKSKDKYLTMVYRQTEKNMFVEEQKARRKAEKELTRKSIAPKNLEKRSNQ